jgi:deoxyribonuclease (pyrimidine dimer)
MTRINVGISPRMLSTKMLIAEHREIKRIPNAVVKKKVNLKDIPKEFTLGTGHVRFFYDKGLYTYKRYMSIYNECIRRGCKVQDYSSAWKDYPAELYNNWSPTDNAITLIKRRLKEKEKPINNKMRKLVMDVLTTAQLSKFKQHPAAVEILAKYVEEISIKELQVIADVLENSIQQQLISLLK